MKNAHSSQTRTPGQYLACELKRIHDSRLFTPKAAEIHMRSQTSQYHTGTDR